MVRAKTYADAQPERYDRVKARGRHDLLRATALAS